MPHFIAVFFGASWLGSSVQDHSASHSNSYRLTDFIAQCSASCQLAPAVAQAGSLCLHKGGRAFYLLVLITFAFPYNSGDLEHPARVG
jgi:hypothetical protein